MSKQTKTAFVTGGSSGIARALSERLLSRGYHIFIADRDLAGAKDLAAQHNSPSEVKVHYAGTDVSSWDSQLAAFKQALGALKGRIDFVAPIAGIGERKWIPSPEECEKMPKGEFAKPDLSVIDVDLVGVLHTVALAVQQFRRQEQDEKGYRGKIGIVASVCGFYHVPTLPIYTAAKHGVAGLTRTYGQLLPDEGITINAVCPNVVQTNISTKEFYNRVGKENIIVPMEELMKAYEDILDGNASGDLYECGPNGGFVKRDPTVILDKETERSIVLVTERARSLHYPEV